MASVQAKAIVLLDTDKRLGLVSFTPAGCPGVLLPVANRPILWYILKNLEKSGISSAILVRKSILIDCTAAGYRHLEAFSRVFIGLNVHYCGFDIE